MIFSPREAIRGHLRAALETCAAQGLIPRVPDEIPIERAKRPEHGDFATNVALALAKQAGKPPRVLADGLVAALKAVPGGELAEASVAGPGFINLRLSEAFWRRVLGMVLEQRDTWGQGAARARPRVVLEYVSANPTGPLHFAHGRHAAVGDALARLLRFAGFDVCREFYVNDAGNQVATLALSVWVRYMEAAAAASPAGTIPSVSFPDEGYKGAYVRDFGKELWDRDGARWVGPTPPADIDPIKRFAIDRCLGLVKDTLGRFDVTFDVWQSERALHETGEVKGTLEALERAGFIDHKEGAVWLKTTALWGDDKDRVVVKSDGLPTYLLADIAYHRKKLARGFEELCDIWGADHHGHIPRMKAALKAFGHDPACLSVLLIQTVRLLREGQEVKMGKRSGEFITLDDVVEEVGRDATRYFYLMRRHDTGLDFDLELAKRQSMDNPVYYAQYAHARCVSLRRRAEALGAPLVPFSPELAALLTLPEEIGLLRKLGEFPDFVADAAEAREPHRLTLYIAELAGEFQSYYTRLQKVHGDTILPQERQRVGAWRESWDWRKTSARLAWVEGIRQVLQNALGLLGVSAPEELRRAAAESDDDVGDVQEA